MASDDELFTIEQLAARTGLTVRNIRSHVTRGLLPPPHLRGRTGFYGAEHVARLELITGLQQQGFNLTSIQKLISGPAAPSPEETLAFYRTVLGPWLTEGPEVWNDADLAAQFGLRLDEVPNDRLQALGVLEPLPDGRVRVLNPALVRAGRQLADLGFGIQHLLTLVQVLMEHSQAVADAFVQTFLDVRWKAYVEAGQPPEQLTEIQAVIEQLQPLASQAVVAAFQQAMTEATARTVDRLSSSFGDDTG